MLEAISTLEEKGSGLWGYIITVLSGSYLCVCVGKQSKRLTARKKYKIERKVHPPKTSCFRLYGNKADCVHIWPKGEGTQAEDEEGSQAESKVQKLVLCNVYQDFIILPFTHIHNLISQSSRKILVSLTSIRLKSSYWNRLRRRRWGQRRRERGRNDNDRKNIPRGGAYKGCRMMLGRELKILRREWVVGRRGWLEESVDLWCTLWGLVAAWWS